MISLEKPDISAEGTFKACIDRIRNPDLRDRLAGVTPLVVIASADFDIAAQANTLHLIAAADNVGGTVSEEEMGNVYNYRMVRSGSPGRTIYDQIYTSAPQGRCPLCAHRGVATLDHHLPKSRHPALAVAPLNLVPACSNCNHAKLALNPDVPEEAPLHPYYDAIDHETWLTAEVLHQQPAALHFRALPPHHWSDVLKARVLNHFKILRLASLYASEAAEELLNIRYELQQILAGAGAAAVQEHLSDRADSCRVARRNGWRTIAYTTWSNSDWFCAGGFKPGG